MRVLHGTPPPHSLDCQPCSAPFFCSTYEHPFSFIIHQSIFSSSFAQRTNILSHLSSIRAFSLATQALFRQVWYTMEPLSGAASVIGVVSLAIQICDELKKLHDFWQSVKEAPDDIANISAELKIFMTLLTVIANNYQRHGCDDKSPNKDVATDTLKLCLTTVHDMSTEVRDLESGITKDSSSRRWASVKFVFRKDKREKAMAQMERMKSLLIIVQTCYLT